jgi:hypothetical protein
VDYMGGGSGTLNPAERSARCAGGIKLHRQSRKESPAGSLKWFLHPSIGIKKQRTLLRSILCFLVPVVGL